MAADNIADGDEKTVQAVYHRDSDPVVRFVASRHSRDPEFLKKVISEGRTGDTYLWPQVYALVSGAVNNQTKRWESTKLPEEEAHSWMVSTAKTHLLTPKSGRSLGILDAIGSSLSRDDDESNQVMADIASIPRSKDKSAFEYNDSWDEYDGRLTQIDDVSWYRTALHVQRSPAHLLQVIAAQPEERERLLAPSTTTKFRETYATLPPDVQHTALNWDRHMTITPQMMDHPLLGPALTRITTDEDSTDRAAVHPNPEVRYALARNPNAPVAHEDLQRLIGDEDPRVAESARRLVVSGLGSF